MCFSLCAGPLAFVALARALAFTFALTLPIPVTSPICATRIPRTSLAGRLNAWQWDWLALSALCLLEILPIFYTGLPWPWSMTLTSMAPTADQLTPAIAIACHGDDC